MRFLKFALASIFLHLSQPSAWNQAEPHVWFAPLGIGVALIAWFGPRMLLLVAADSLFVSFQAYLLSASPDYTFLWMAIPRAALEAGEVGAAWWCYHRLAHGRRSLDDLRSATLFLFLVPGLVGGVFTFVDVLSMSRGGPIGTAVTASVAELVVMSCPWRNDSDAILASVLTPLLVQRGLVPRDPSCKGELNVFTDRLRRGDCLEIAGLAIGTCLVGLVLLRRPQAAGKWPAGNWACLFC